MPKILWFTSFNKELYTYTGEKCVQSFYDKKVHGDFLTLSEGFACADTPLNYNLDNSIFLQNWLQNNKDVIPYYMGGEAKECICPNGLYAKHHNKGCYFQGWNRQASRWFRKIACYHHVLNIYKDYDYYIWIDCDTEFTHKISTKFIVNLFGDNELLYLKGQKRNVDEVGFVGFVYSQQVIKFFNMIFNCYVSKTYRKFVRWDDGYIFWKVRKNFLLKTRDLAKGANKTSVFSQSTLKEYMKHFKGNHARNLDSIK